MLEIFFIERDFGRIILLNIFCKYINCKNLRHLETSQISCMKLKAPVIFSENGVSDSCTVVSWFFFISNEIFFTHIHDEVKSHVMQQSNMY